MYEVLHVPLPEDLTISEKQEREGSRINGDMTDILKEIYTHDTSSSSEDEIGKPTPDYKHITDQLEADQILYLQEFELYREYRSAGLGMMALCMFHTLLRQLPAEHSFTGTIALWPCSTDAPSRPDKTKRELEADLIKFYEKFGYRLVRHVPSEDDSARMIGVL